MDRRAKLVLGGAVLVALLGALLWGWPSAEGAGRSSADESSLSDSLVDVLSGSGGSSSSDEAREAARLLQQGDAGIRGTLGAWSPTATVSQDLESPFGTLAGRVINREDGSPIGGAELLFDRDGATVSTTSGPDGRFILVATEAGRHGLAIASAEGFLSYAPEWGHSPIAFTARPEERIDGVSIALEPERRVEVEVVDPSGEGVADAEVTLIGAGSRERALAPADEVYRTGADGRVTVSAWDRALLEARRAGARGRARVRGQSVRIALSEVAAASDGVIEGRVVGPGDVAVEGAVVQAFVPRRGNHASGQAVSDEEGRFSVRGLDPRAHMLIATHPDHPRTRLFGVSVGQADVVLRMPAGLHIAGRVIDGAGSPVPAFTVVARRATGALRRTTVASVSSYDPAGHFVVTGLTEEGTYELTASARGMPPSAAVSATPGREVTLTLEAGGRLEGVVRDSEGVGIEGAHVELTGYLGRGTSAAPLEVQTRADAGGRFALDGVGAEPRSIRVRADGFHERLLSNLSVRPGETRRVDVVLEAVAEGEEPRTELAGIGAILRPGSEFLVVLRVVPGGGAQSAGLQRGDRILSVDGTPVTDLGFGGSLERIRGEVGTVVRLEVRPAREEAARVYAITRVVVRT
ncbi:MAG: carboxypeptidase regulatory-like domain-containing protein [Sandaracinaceae bacterium]